MGPSAYIRVRHRLFSSDPSRLICWYFCWYRENKRSRRLSLFRTKGIEQMARKNDGACANPKQIRTDADCRAARPRFDNAAWSPAKISDVTGGGLYLFVTPDESRPGNAASKLWRMGYRFHSRQKTYSIGPYGNGKDGTFSLADARRARQGKRPAQGRQRPEHREAARQAQAGGRPAFRAMGRRVAREEEGGESQTRQDRRGARPQDHRGARAACRLRQGSLRQAVQGGHQASGRARVHAFIRSRWKAGNPRPRAQHR